MKQLEFQTQIDATPRKVWETLWNAGTYSRWASALSGESYYEGDWSEGSEVLIFDASRNGMFNLVEKNVPHKQMAFKHLGWFVAGEKQAQNWQDSRESFNLEEIPGGTLLTIKVDALDEFAGFFESKFPAALENIKRLAEEK